MTDARPVPDTRRSARPVVALGGFDGVHLGHRRIVEHALALARELDGIPAALTFDPLPAQVINPDFTFLLTSLATKTRLLTELGIELVHVVRFSDELRAIEPEEFVVRHLLGPLDPAGVVIGHDHRFGRGGRGDAALLERLLGPRGIRLEVVPEFTFDDAPVRSTRIRESLVLGVVGAAARLLGRWYRLSGAVVPGTGTGRKLGFPTVNIRPWERETLVPADGVYACRVETLGRRFDAVLNIGHRPTFGGETRTIEAHLLGFAGGAQPQAAEIDIIERIRTERRFASPAELSEQIRHDIGRATELLAAAGPAPRLDSTESSR
jgi:riboflavin kinase/FMN adenylyltransferase